MMDLAHISFDLTFINDVFPFHMIMDNNFVIVSIGKSLKKLNVNMCTHLENEFIFLRPNKVEYSKDSILKFQNQIVVLKSIHNPKLLLRGQFIIYEEKGLILFLGGPWITSAEELMDLNLIIPDFALHDPITDLIQVVKSKDIVMEDIKKLVEVLRNQKVELEKSEIDLKTASNRLSVLIQNLQSGILVENENRQIVLVNHLFCDFFNIPLPPEELIGLDCSQSAEQNKHLFKNPELFIRSITKILEEKKLVMGEELIMKDNTILERNYIPILNGDIYQGHLWQYTDITLRKLSEKELIEAKENAIKSKKAKEQFMANISHEIRTPINIIGGVSSLILDSNLTKDQKEKIEIIKFSSENLLSLVNDILDFEKIDSKKLILEKEPFELVHVIKNTVNSMKFLAENRKVELSLFIDSVTPRIVIGDQLRFKQILINLINNAIKFTEKGFVKVTVESKIINKKEVEVIVNIQDSGIGIDKDEIDNIFKRFTQANSATTRNYGGTGLGLTIVKKLVELHNAKMSVTSKLGVGTMFEIQFPFSIGLLPVPDETKIELDSNMASLEFVKILLVEDNTLNQMVMEGILNKYNPVLFKAENGKEAIKFLNENEVDLILMDIQMPEMDGYETTQYIRKYMQNKNSRVPIIAITANSSNLEKVKSFEVGMNDLIAKPFKEKKLVSTLLSYLKSKKGKAPLQFSDLSYLEEFYNGDRDKINAIIKQFLIQTPEHLMLMNVHLVSKKWIELSLLAHKMKSTLAYVGMDEAKIILDELEEKSKSSKANASELEISALFERLTNNLILAHNELKQSLE